MRGATKTLGGPAAALALAALGLVLGGAGCGANREVRRVNEAALAAVPPATAQADRAESLTAALAAWRAAEAQRGRTYLVAPGDVLEVQVYELEALDQNHVLALEVSPSGDVRLPLIGAVRAAGQSTDGVSRTIQRRLAADYMVDPQVSVSVKEYHGRQVTVMGAVEKPGVLNLRQSAITLLDALAMAGGLSERAGGTILVARGPPSAGPAEGPAPAEGPPATESGPSAKGPAPADGAAAADAAAPAADAATPAADAATRLSIDLEELLEGRADRNLLLGDGDVVHVPEARQFYVTGLVAKPGAYVLRRPTTVLEAVATAGGMSDAASPEATRLVRMEGGVRRVVAVPLHEAAAGGEANLRLAPDDVLEVVQTPGKRFWTGFAEGFSRVFGIGVSIGSF